MPWNDTGSCLISDCIGVRRTYSGGRTTIFWSHIVAITQLLRITHCRDILAALGLVDAGSLAATPKSQKVISNPVAI